MGGEPPPADGDEDVSVKALLLNGEAESVEADAEGVDKGVIKAGGELIVAGWPSFASSGYDPTVLWPPARRRLFGLAAAVVAGALSGSTFDAPQWVVDHAPASSPVRLEDQLFAHFSGILLTSTAIFALYASVTRNQPWVSAPLTLPALASGVCWGLATLAWFEANARLSIVIAFPIITIGPGVLSLVIGGLFFREVKGIRATVLLTIACTTFSAAAVCIALSA